VLLPTNWFVSLVTQATSQNVWPRFNSVIDELINFGRPRVPLSAQPRCFHKNEFKEMPCNLNSTQNLRLFEKYPTLPLIRYSPPKKEREKESLKGGLAVWRLINQQQTK